MNGKKEYGDSAIFTISNYIWWYFLGNLYFVLLNFPLLLVLLGLLTGIVSKPSILIIGLSCIPIGPSLAALFGVGGKLTREQDVDLTPYFFKAYKNSFKQSVLFCTAEILLLIILYVDKQYFLAHHSYLIYFLQFLTFFTMILGLYALVIISRFNLKSKDLLKLCIASPALYVKTTLLNVAILLTFIYFFYIQPLFTLVFLVSLFAYGIMFINKKMLEDIEKSFLKID